MQVIIAFSAYIIILFSVFMWRNSYDIVVPATEEKRIRKEKRQQFFLGVSAVVISFSFIFLLVFSNIHWFGIWGLLAITSAVWGVVYFIIHLIEKRNPLEGRVSKNKWLNLFLTEGVFSYFYVYVWLNLAIFVYQNAP